MVHRGEDAKVFGDQQDSSRPGRQAIDTVHKKTLSYDISRIQHSSLAMFDNDASGAMLQLHSCVALDYCGSPSGDALQGNQNAGYGSGRHDILHQDNARHIQRLLLVI
jgi:hypothetical protein